MFNFVTLLLRLFGRGKCIFLAAILLVRIGRLRSQGLLRRQPSITSQPLWAARAVDINGDRNGKDAQCQIDHNSIAKFCGSRGFCKVLNRSMKRLSRGKRKAV